MVKVPLYGIHDFQLQTTTAHENPFRVRLTATFEHASGTQLRNVPGFYNGDGQFVVRFSPTQVGTWRGLTASEDAELDGIALAPIEVTARANPNAHGPLAIDFEHIERFVWDDGTPFIYLGFEWDWLFAYQQADPARCCEHVKRVSGYGFNAFIINLYAHTGFATPESHFEGDVIPGTVYGPPQRYVFAGTNDDPDHSRLNVAFFKDYDALMHLLAEHGIVAHMMIQVQNKGVAWPERLTPEDETFWRYVVARYQAFGNLIWDVGKESHNLLKETGSHDYTLSRIGLIRATDAYDHLVTVHDAEAGSAGRVSVADDAGDVMSDQIHLADVDRYNREAQRKLQLLHKPYINIEYGYEVGVEPLKTYTSRTTAPWQEVLRWTYAIYLAGAYPGYYYSNTAWDLIRVEPEPPGWSRYRYLKELLDELPFNRMRANNLLVDRGLCLAEPGLMEPGKVYLIYLDEGGDAVVDLTGVRSKRGPIGQIESLAVPVTAEWMAITTGERRRVAVDRGGWMVPLDNPFEDTTQPVVVVVRVEA